MHAEYEHGEAAAAELSVSLLSESVRRVADEHGEAADAVNEAVGTLVTDHPDKLSGYGTISMNPVKIPRALA